MSPERELLLLAGITLVLGWALFRLVQWLNEPSSMTFGVVVALGIVAVVVVVGSVGDKGSW